MKIAIAVIIAIIVIAGGYFLFASRTQAPVTNPATAGGTSAPLETTNPNADANANATGDLGIAAPGDAAANVSTATHKTVTVTYNGAGFSPSSVTIKKGDSVKFVDAASAPMWVASNPHPIHSGYSGTSVTEHCPDTAGTAFDQCSTGSSYTFTFEKVGSWGYHNHANHGATGVVVVTQ